MAAKIKPGEEFLGVGYVGPLKQGSTGDVVTKAGIELIAESIKTILSTKARIKRNGFFAGGERLMRDNFGSRIHALRHENIDDDTVALFEAYLVSDITLWEPRAVVTGVQTKINEAEESMQCLVSFQALGTNATGNLVVIRNKNGKIVFREL